MKDIEKLVNINDEDVEIIYRRKAKASNEDINGFNPIILVGVFIFALVGLVVISQNDDNPPAPQSAPVIINNN